MFKKLGRTSPFGKSAEQKAKEADEVRENEEMQSMQEEEELRRKCMPAEQEEDARATMEAAEQQQREVALRIEAEIARMAIATPELPAPLPPSFRALEEINEFSVIPRLKHAFDGSWP